MMFDDYDNICLNDTECCGLHEIYNIQRVSADVILLDNEFDDDSCAFYLFTDTGGSKRSSGGKLAKFITENKLGIVTASPTKRNPNSQNMLTVWVWAVNRRAFNAWRRKNRKNAK